MEVHKINAAILLATGLLLASATALGQSPMPQSKTWSFKEIIADDQYAAPPFRSIVQGKDGLVYVADGVGVLEFDGIKWARLPLPDARFVTALGITDDGDIIVGGSEFLLALSSEGHEVRVKDLAGDVPGGLVGLGHIWEFASGTGSWCVRSERKLLCKDSRGMFVLPAENGFGRLFAIGGELYVRDEHLGLMRISGRSLELVKGGEFYAERRLAMLMPFGSRGLAGISHDPFEIATWVDLDHDPTPVSLGDADALHGYLGMAGALEDGATGLPFVNGDLVILDKAWNEVARFQASQFGALPGAQAIHVDDEGGIWVAWSNAITRIDWPSRVSLFQESQGIYESPAGVIEDSLGIIAYTSKSLTLLKNDERTSAFERMTPNNSWIHQVASHDGDILVLTSDGIRNSDGRILLLPKRDVFTYFVTPERPNEALVGLRFGLARIQKIDAHWVENEMRSDVSFDVLGITQDSDGSIWLSSNLSRVARVVPKPGSDALADAQLVEFDEGDGVPAGELMLKLIGGEVHVGSLTGFHHFSNGRFEPSSRIDFDQTGPVKQFLPLNANELLVAGPSGRLRLLSRGVSGIYSKQPSVFDGIAGLGNIRDIMMDKTGIVWLATDSGVVRVNPSVNLPTPKTLQVLIREISSGERVLYSGHGMLPSLNLAEGDSMRFSFALPSYRAPEINNYRSRIRHVDGSEVWSKWSNEVRRDFTNLPAGNLLFEVEARDVAGTQGGIASVPITVIAPWYRRTSTVIAFWLAGLALLVIAVQLRVRALRTRSAELERLVAFKTEALQHAAATDPLTGLWNRHRFGEWVRDQAPAIAQNAMRARSGDPVDVIVCAIDLDHFKRINDHHGHAAGDIVLKAVAQRLQGMKRQDDLIFRFGGEEFIYLAMNRHREEGEELARHIVEEMKQTTVELESGVLLDPTASVGWTTYPFYRERAELFSMDFVIGVADRALYLAKERGRNCSYGYLPNLSVDEIDRTQADWRTQVFDRHPDLLKQV
ncbi:diguanylate cyclase [Dokdonella sp.]|uniref:ligand-binding sensor domain-containing diguanylate cyclase n=1 Tax=Dokdonella sp. TaxID=2291710 RepID=UPI003C4096C9